MHPTVFAQEVPTVPAIACLAIWKGACSAEMRSYRSPGEVHDGNFFLLRAASIPSSKYGIKVQEQLNGSVPISENVRVSLTASRSGSPMKERLRLGRGWRPKAKADGKIAVSVLKILK